MESHIEIASGSDSTTITETLEGRSRAIAAIVFAVFVLIVLLGTIVSEFINWRSHPAGVPNVLVFLSALWFLEAALGVVVLDQSYRQTLIRVRDGELTLIFSALISPTRQHSWPVNQVGELRIVSTQSGAGLASLAELRLHPAPEISIHLFTDHREAEVRQITAVISRAIKGEHDVPLAVPSVLAGPDGGSVHHLLETQRAAREAAERARRLLESRARD